ACPHTHHRRSQTMVKDDHTHACPHTLHRRSQTVTDTHAPITHTHAQTHTHAHTQKNPRRVVLVCCRWTQTRLLKSEFTRSGHMLTFQGKPSTDCLLSLSH